MNSISEERWQRAVSAALKDAQVRDAIYRRVVNDAELNMHLVEQRPEVQRACADSLKAEQEARDHFTAADSRSGNESELAKWIRDTGHPAAITAIVNKKVAEDAHSGATGPAVAGMRQLQAACKGLPLEMTAQPRAPHSIADSVAISMFLLGIAALVVLLVSVIVYMIRDGWGHVAEAFVAPWSVGAISGVMFVVCLVIFIPVFFRVISKTSPFETEVARLRPSVLDKAKGLAAAVTEHDQEIALARQHLTAAVTKAELAVRDEVVARARAFADQKHAPNYSDHIPELPDGLGNLTEVTRADNRVDTRSRDELLQLIASMAGGSIGVAGPRGAGKSTLLQQITTMPELTIRDRVTNAPRPTLGVFTSAPVRYDGREFILHLFATVCGMLLKSESRSGARQWEEAMAAERRQPPPRYEQSFLSTLRVARSVASAAAFVFLVLGTAALFIPKPSVAPPLVVQINGGQAEVQEQKSAAPPSGLVVVAQRLDLRPLPLLALSLLCLVAALLVRRFLGEVPPSEIDRRTDLDASTRREPAEMPATGGAGKAAWASLTALAAEWDVELRYQQSFTSGWSGALKLPVGMDISSTRSTSLISRQLTYPELTKAFRDFLELLTQFYVVVIAVDELDKITEAEHAHQFLNEVKAVFGVAGVFYLISISDSAMSSFARRGLAVRDAFDSAFDEVVRVTYLDHPQSKNILARRIIGLPEPLISFCHCLSGGLPRDLIRACRSVFAEANELQTRSLGDVVKSLVRKDVQAKVDATVTYVLDLAGGSVATPAVVAMRRLQRAVESGSDLQTACQGLIDVAAGMSETAAANDVIRRHIADAAADLAIYTVYSATLCRAFNAYPSEQLWRNAQDERVFSDISDFRRALSLNSQSTNAELSEFRNRHQMSTLVLA